MLFRLITLRNGLHNFGAHNNVTRDVTYISTIPRNQQAIIEVL